MKLNGLFIQSIVVQVHCEHLFRSDPYGSFQNASSLPLTLVKVHRLLRPLCGSKLQFDEDKNASKWRRAANLFNACAALWWHSFTPSLSLLFHVSAPCGSFAAFHQKICHLLFTSLFFLSCFVKKQQHSFRKIVTFIDWQPNEPASSVIEWAFSVLSVKCEEVVINACILSKRL